MSSFYPPANFNILITGVTGFIGSHLAHHLAHGGLGAHTVQVHGLVRWRSSTDYLHRGEPYVAHYGDLLDMASLERVLDDVQPDWVFHLAAQSHVPFSFLAPAFTMEVNVTGTVNLLEAIRRMERPPSRIHVASSSEVYGQVQRGETPIKETNPFRPANPYAISKVAVDMLARHYFEAYGLPIIRTRFFTITGPGQSPAFFASSFAKQIAEVEAGKRAGPIEVGNLDSVRTILDVRDLAGALVLLITLCKPGEVYNIGGDFEWKANCLTVREVLAKLTLMARGPIRHQVSPGLLRPVDVTLQMPDSRKFREATGWAPQTPLEMTLRDLLEWHRGLVSGHGDQVTQGSPVGQLT